MGIKLTITVTISKLIIKICRLLSKGGTTLPGKIALKIHSDILKSITSDVKIIVITGTNGKTTTTRIVGQILKENGIKYISNKSGANLLSGIASTFIDATDFTGRCPVKTALIEVDEATFNAITDYIEIDILIITNFFRDQLDRYGELYNTLKGISGGIAKAKKVKLILNADDSLCVSLGRESDRTTLFYGFAPNTIEGGKETSNLDAVYCLYCKTRYSYTYHVYAHLGGFLCPNCGYSRPDSDITCTRIIGLSDKYSIIEYSMAGLPDTYTAKINLPGLYNIYNSLAAITCGYMLGLSAESIANALSKVECGFGRMETVAVSGKNIKLVLVKNPSGFNQVLDFLLLDQQKIQIAIAINDKLADGTDVSWLWDVDFEKLQFIQGRINSIITCGTRSEDMSVRLKYAGINTNKIYTLKNYDVMINTCLKRMDEDSNFYILPTYTALLDIRRVLKNKFGLKEFWI